jgi:hypothetical protein
MVTQNLSHEEEYAIEVFKGLMSDYGGLVVTSINKLLIIVNEQKLTIDRLEKELKLLKEI